MGDHELSCPELGAFERLPLAADVRAHVAGCRACELVLGVVAARERASPDAACVPFDALLAARADGTINRAGRNLLERHLASCEACRLVADTLSPTADTAGDHAALPSVDPAAYALGLEVARGGMGRILAARDLRVGRPVAVKELLGTSPQLAARFEREARVTARLQHPGIVPIYEIGTWPDGTPFYSMRMVDGRTLREAIDGASTLAARLALLPAVIAACEAIAFAHAQRVIHRDLTPSNILVGAYGETVVIDWGLAKDLSIATDDADDDDDGAPYRTAPAADAALTQAGAVIGTAAYMPPEQARAGHVDERADVYALGAILYHLLAGVAPYEAPTAAALLDHVKRGPPPPIERCAPAAPGDLASIVTKAMAREPADRYPSARELTTELQRFQTGHLVRAHAYSVGERVWRFVRRHRAAVVTTVLAAVLVTVVAGVAVIRVVRSRGDARRTAQALLLEKGRVELLAGNTFGALAYLHAASSPGPRSPALAFLTGAAMRAAQPSSLLDCGGYAYAVDLSPDGAFVAAACTRQGVIWRLGDRVKVATLGPLEGGFSGLRYAPDGATLATWGPRGAARLWDARTGTLRGTFAHGAEITTASFSPDGARLVTTGFDGHATVWDVATGAQLRAIPAAMDGLLRTVYGRMSPDGRAVYTSTLAGEGRAWDATTGALLGGYAHGSFTLGGDVSADGRLALSCGVDRLAKVWDASTGNLRLALAGHSDVVWRCLFDPQVTHALTTGHDGRANVWDLATGALVVGVEHGDILTSAEFSPDGRRFATIGVDGRAKVWDARSGALLASVDARRGKHARFTPDSRGLIVQRGDGRIEVWDDVASQLVAFTPAQGVVLEVSSDARRTITEDAAGWIALWDTARATRVETVALHAPIAVAAGAPVLAATADTGVAVVALETGATTRVVPVEPRSLVLSADGARLGVVRPNGTAEVWDARAGRRLAHLGRATSLALSADGRRALVRAEHGAFVVWDVATATRAAVLVVAADARVLGLSADGRRAVIMEAPGAPGQAASLWNTDTGQLMLRESVVIARLDPSGRRLTTIGIDRRVRVQRLADGGEVTAFEAEQLLDAQVDAQGALVAALGEYGKAALVLDARDGRVLARWPVEHAAPAVTQTGFRPPGGAARWSADGTAVVARSRGVTVWRAASTSHAALAAAMNRVPWRVEDGQLVALRDRTLRARIVRAGVPVAGATVSLEIRRAPALGPGEITWDSIRTRYTTHATRSDRAGRIRVTGLEPGTYHLVVATSDGATRAFEAFAPADRADVSEQTLDLAAPP